MKRAIVSFTLASLLSGCALQQQPASTSLYPAELTNPTPPPVHIPPDPLDALSPAVRRAYLEGSTEAIRDGITVMLPYSEHTRPTIVTSPLHVTEIVLADDEHLTNAVIGDSDRFSVEARGNHILIKPTPAGQGHGGAAGSYGATQASVLPTETYSTNLIAQTDKRTYHFIVRSTPHTWIEQLTFYYPADITEARIARANAIRQAAQQTAQASTPDSLDFAYRIDGPNLPWKPLQVFSDRSHTYIQFADSAALAGDMPVLFTGNDKNPAIVNYTTRDGNTFIADRVLTSAALVEGQGTNRQVVRIESTDGD